MTVVSGQWSLQLTNELRRFAGGHDFSRPPRPSPHRPYARTCRTKLVPVELSFGTVGVSTIFTECRRDDTQDRTRTHALTHVCTHAHIEMIDARYAAVPSNVSDGTTRNAANVLCTHLLYVLLDLRRLRRLITEELHCY